MTEEPIVVCQVPMCFAIGDERIIGEHSYFYCDDHARAWGWCEGCGRFVGRRAIYAYGLCADCLETVPLESAAALDAAIVEMIDEMVKCPHCESTDVIMAKDGGFCHACNQTWRD